MREKQLMLQLLSLLIGYLRWTQVVPMILTWMALLFMLVAMLFVNHQQEGFSMLEVVTAWLSSLPWVGDEVKAWQQGGGISLSSVDFRSLALKIWGGVSLLFMALDWLLSQIVGFRPQRSLKAKIILAMIASLFLFAGFVMIYLFDSGQFMGSTISWMLMFAGLALISSVVSAYSLSVSHWLARISQQMAC